MILLFLVACSGSQPGNNPTLPPSNDCPPFHIQYEVTGVVPESEINLIKTSFHSASCYLKANTQSDIKRPFLAKITEGTNPTVCCAQFRADINWTSFFLVFNVDHPSWMTRSAAFKHKIGAHEYIHMWQADQGCMTRANETRPLWLTEGIAEYLAYEVSIQEGLFSSDEVGKHRRDSVRLQPNKQPLSEMEVQIPEGVFYEILALGAEILLEGKSLSSVRGFCNGISKDNTWQSAFEQAFGETPTTFYDRFEAYRNSLK